MAGFASSLTCALHMKLPDTGIGIGIDLDIGLLGNGCFLLLSTATASEVGNVFAT